MANLTGDFDVVAEFSLTCADRVLAGMHRIERFPHSLSARVDDNPPPGRPKTGPILVGAVDAFGVAVVNQQQIGKPNPYPGASAATDPARSLLDQILNPDLVGATVGQVIPSHLQGTVQMQLAPPELGVEDRSGTNLTVHQHLMCRYFPDKNTTPLAEFIRGDLLLTAPVTQMAKQSPIVKAIDVNIKADQVVVNFVPANVTLSPEDSAAINLAIRNALRTSFLPSNFPLPSIVNFMSFKTIFGPPRALVALLNLGAAQGDAQSFNNLFLGATDDFAIGVGRDFILSSFDPLIETILQMNIPPQSFPLTVWGVTVDTINASFTITNASVDLQETKIVLTIEALVSTDSIFFGQFSATITQEFGLQPSGSTANLTVGNLSVHTSSSLANLISGYLTSAVTGPRDQALSQSGALQKVRQQLDAQIFLGGFLDSMFTPANPRPHAPRQGYLLTYNSVEIHADGIVLHGALSLSLWPAAHVEFEEIPSTSIVATQGHDYTALNSWIPGGKIQRFDWSMKGQPPFVTDENKFVLFQPPPEVNDVYASTTPVTAFIPLCLTLRGTRLSEIGPVVPEPVVATACGVTRVSVLGGIVAGDGQATIALAQPSPQGQIIVNGHIPTKLAAGSGAPPNRIVYFADDRTSGNLDFLKQALVQSKREDATTAIVAVLTPAQLSKSRYVTAVIYADDHNGAWERVFGVKSAKRPLTLIVNPYDKVVWQHEGDIDTATLAAALAKGLQKGGVAKVDTMHLNLRLGNPSPNFLFEYIPGRQLTLRKTAGRPVALYFWNSVSQPSIDAIKDAEAAAGASKGPASLILAINDGEPEGVARKVAAANGLTSIIVPDPKREISAAYGVTMWPTIVNVDATGAVSGARFGRGPVRTSGPPSAGKNP